MAARRFPNRLTLAEFFDQHLPRVISDNIIADHYLDLNGFKPVNDKHGHIGGDELLFAVGKRLRRAIRETDMVARLGRDEFAIVQIDMSNPEEAHALSWRIRDTIDQPFEIDQLSISVSASIGTAINAEPFACLSEMLDQADSELYRVKRAMKRLQLVAV
ncbi:GGDEF domain-containing protein [Novosphingobium chloroacetimidivorans]|nr:GGDEF domain-containing protein [Novosphingobium chloroacetimidivorans]